MGLGDAARGHARSSAGAQTSASLNRVRTDVMIHDWRLHPARDRPIAAVVVVCLVATAGILAVAAAGSCAVGVASAVFLVLTLRRLFFPALYEIDEHGGEVRCIGVETRRPWSRLRRFRYGDAGAFLS